MKKIIPILLLLLPLIVCSQGQLYQKYASRQDLTVAQVSGFRLTDDVRVDVVLVVAENEEAWQRLMEEYGIRWTEGSTSWLGEADQPARRTSWTGKPVCKVIVSHERRTIAFYQLDNIAQYDALLEYQLNTFDQHNANKTKKRKSK